MNKCSLIDDSFNFEAYQWLFIIKNKIKIDDEINKNISKMISLLDENKISEKEMVILTEALNNLKIDSEDLFYLINDLSLNKTKNIIQISITMFNSGMVKESIRLLLETYKKYPDNIQIVYALALLLYKTGDKDSAINLLEKNKENQILSNLLIEIKTNRV